LTTIETSIMMSWPRKPVKPLAPWANLNISSHILQMTRQVCKSVISPRVIVVESLQAPRQLLDFAREVERLHAISIVAHHEVGVNHFVHLLEPRVFERIPKE
jgi:hypothetical protein